MPGLLEGKIAWVTGAAGALGAEICRRFAAEGAKIALSGRTADKLAAVAEELPASAEAFPCVADVIARADVERAAKAILDRFGRIDILVNSTTCPIFGDFLELSDEDWMSVLNAKALGYMRTSRAVIPSMVENGGGAIVNISGRGGHQPNSPSHMAGSCANAAVNTLTKGLANMYGPKGIRVNAVAPGPVRSQRWDVINAANKKLADKSGAPARSGVATASPLGDTSEPSDIADAALFFASGQSRFITGVILQADGGGTASL